MRTVDIAKISIPKGRMRAEFDTDAIAELAMSIQSKGLLHPVTLIERADGYELRAGERRFRAITLLYKNDITFSCDGAQVPRGHVPWITVGEMSEIELLELEFEENVKRVDLTWQEQVEARKRLFELRRLQAQEQGIEYTASSLAKELATTTAPDVVRTQVLKQLTVGKYLHHEEVRNAKTLREAESVVRKIAQKTLTEALGDTLTASNEVPKHQLVVGDALELIKAQPDNYFNCILTDPPYGINIHESGSVVAAAHHYEDSPETLERIIDALPFQLYRVTRPAAHVYWFCDLTWFSKICAALEDAGFETYKYPIIWHKRGKSMAPDISKWPQRNYECIVYAIKGNLAPYKLAGDVLDYAYPATLQQAEKPVPLFVDLLSRSVLAGGKILDPFCGSGAIFLAAEEVQCSATGFVIDTERAAMAKLRAFGEL